MAGLPSEFKSIDVLGSNAGLSLNLEPAHKVPIDDWETMVDTNIKGFLYCTRLILPGMVERGRGHVVNIGSVAALYPSGWECLWSNQGVCEAIFIEPPGRVTDINPGLADTEFSLIRFKDDNERAANLYKGTMPLTPEDIAETVY